MYPVNLHRLLTLFHWSLLFLPYCLPFPSPSSLSSRVNRDLSTRVKRVSAGFVKRDPFASAWSFRLLDDSALTYAFRSSGKRDPTCQTVTLAPPCPVLRSVDLVFVYRHRTDDNSRPRAVHAQITVGRGNLLAQFPTRHRAVLLASEPGWELIQISSLRSLSLTRANSL